MVRHLRRADHGHQRRQFVSPAYDISNLYLEKIDFRLGGLISSILSVMVCPWVLVSSPQAITIFVSLLRRDHRRRRLGPADRATLGGLFYTALLRGRAISAPSGAVA